MIYTITFGEVSENHVGMQKIGEIAEEGFSIDELRNMEEKFENTELISLNEYLPIDIHSEEAYVLVIKNGIDQILSDICKSKEDLLAEHSRLEYDKKYYDRRRSKVLNKNARWNLCFSEKSQEADYENGKGTIVAFNDILLTKYIRYRLPEYIGEKAYNLSAEGNYYYNKKCGIGFHGDAERKRVIALRLGGSMPLHYQWYHRAKMIGKRCELMLNDGDIYIMSEKATGYDWRKSSKVTLRHAAGCDKYLKK